MTRAEAEVVAAAIDWERHRITKTGTVPWPVAVRLTAAVNALPKGTTQ